MRSFCHVAVTGLAVALCSLPSIAQEKPVVNDIPASFTPPERTPYKAPKVEFDYEKRVEMIPMRDGVKLYTVIVVPKGASNAPIVMTRTPYNASKRAARNNSPHMLSILPQGDDVFAGGDYIRVYQDVRGKY